MKHFDWHWQRLVPFFRPFVVKLLVPWFALLPILVTAFAGVPELLSIPTQPVAEIRFALPFKWWLLWWASFLYSIACAVFFARCPKFVSKYPSYSDYLKLAHSPRWIAHEIEDAYLNAGDCKQLFARLITKNLAPEVTKEVEPKPFLKEIRADETVFVFDVAEKRYVFRAKSTTSAHANSVNDAEREAFWEIFEVFAASRPKTRLWIWALLGATLILFLFAILQNIGAVLSHFTWAEDALDFLKHLY